MTKPHQGPGRSALVRRLGRWLGRWAGIVMLGGIAGLTPYFPIPPPPRPRIEALAENEEEDREAV